jgi:hypothetical protein
VIYLIPLIKEFFGAGDFGGNRPDIGGSRGESLICAQLLQ